MIRRSLPLLVHQLFGKTNKFPSIVSECRWTYPLSDPHLSSLAASDGLAFISGSTGWSFALNTSSALPR